MWNPNEITPNGKTLAQIDKEEGEEVRQANEKLKLASNFGARWWSYTGSHNTFELLIGGDPFGKDNLVLSLGACSYISGPVSWQNQKLRIEWHNNPPSEERGWQFTIVDDSVGFKVEAKGFGLESNYNLMDAKHNSPDK